MPQHRSGLPYGRSLPLDAVLAPHWDRSVRALAEARPPLTFGHNGSNACVGWADPARRLVVAYLTNRRFGSPGGGQRCRPGLKRSR
ncbi:hypothetical protein ACIA5C_13750 [Actinoplanes sp. NPDC051343]|uniref:hypothetical protein n=1 Tax=Actinoplanes sp. NPDC051343 TaxID=3363906 RepID=UPI0037A40741